MYFFGIFVGEEAQVYLLGIFGDVSVYLCVPTTQQIVHILGDFKAIVILNMSECYFSTYLQHLETLLNSWVIKVHTFVIHVTF